jgi:uncharacterized protein (DUF302 family)
MSKPLRFWATGAMAVVAAAALQLPERSAQGWSMRSSRHSPRETALRIEQAARAHGLPLFVKYEPAQPLQRAADEPAALVLVLGSDESHTPVMQGAEAASLQLPLTVLVRAPQASGPTEVQFSDSAWLADQAELPAELAQQLAELPRLIDDAIDGA